MATESEAVLEETGVDIFVGNNHNSTPTKEAYESAQRVADTFKECIEIAQGDSGVFTAELNRRTVDAVIRR
mgnify:CR=1 FL=1